MEMSIYMDKSRMPVDADLQFDLDATYLLWNQISQFVIEKHPKAIGEWNFPGQKYGWSFRLKDKKRAIIYLLPRSKEFMVAFVFGQKATDAVFNSSVAEPIKEELRNAKVYAEGRGIRFTVNNQSQLEDVFRLVEIKLNF